MKLETIQTYRSPRWIALFISSATMAIGWLGVHGFDYLSRHFPQTGVRNSMDGTFDPAAFLCVILFFSGMFLNVICCLWILVSAIIRQERPKQL
jgi:hypothetical protein